MTSVQHYDDAVAELREAARGRYAGPTVPTADLAQAVDGIEGLDTQEIAHHMKRALGSTDTAGLSKVWLGGLLQLLKHLAFGLIGDTVAEGIRGWWRNRDDAKELGTQTGQATEALDDIARTSDTAVMEILSALSQSVAALSAHLRCLDPQASPEHEAAFQSSLGSAAALVDQAAQSVTQLCQERDQAVRGCVAELERRAVSMCEGDQPRVPAAVMDSSCASETTRAARATQVSPSAPGQGPSEAPAPPQGEQPGTTAAPSAPSVSQPTAKAPVAGVPTVATTAQCAPQEAPASEAGRAAERPAAQQVPTGGAESPTPQKPSSQPCESGRGGAVGPVASADTSLTPQGEAPPETSCADLPAPHKAPVASSPITDECSPVQTIAAQATAAGLEAVKQGLGLAQQVSAGVTEAAGAFLESLTEEVGSTETGVKLGEKPVCESTCEQPQQEAQPCPPPEAETPAPEPVPTEPARAAEVEECPVQEPVSAEQPTQECPPPEPSEPPEPPECPETAPQPPAETLTNEPLPEPALPEPPVEDLARVPEPEPPAEKLAHMNEAAAVPPAASGEGTDHTVSTDSRETSTTGESKEMEEAAAQQESAPEQSEQPEETQPSGARKAGAW